MTWLFKLFALAATATQAQATTLTYGLSSFAAPGLFPTSLYQSYYNNPTATAAQPQPVISDPVLVRIYTIFMNRSAHLSVFCRTKCSLQSSLIQIIYLR